MDKREEKTLNAIHKAFTKLISEKDYAEITIQEILDNAKISRSTFYSHYKTKDELLLNISNHIFDHIFSHTLEEEKTHDFSKDKIFNYRHLVTHFFYHVLDEKSLFKGIFKSNGMDLFLNEFRKKIKIFVESYFSNYPYKNNIPLNLKEAIVIENFIVILKYWIENDFKETPEDIATYFIESFIAQ